MPPPNLTPLLHLLTVRDDHNKPAEEHKAGGLPGWAIFLIVIIVLGLLAAAAFTVYKLTLGRSSSSGSGGGLGAPLDGARSWVSNLAYKVKNPRARSSTAGYEPSGISAGRAHGATGRGALDPDEAWDARVGTEADYGNPFYEETELQNQTHYSGAGYGAPAHHQPQASLGVSEHAGARGRSRSRDAPATRDPFGDDAASSLRSISPRPVIDTNVATTGKQQGAGSPKTRNSMFREEV